MRAWYCVATTAVAAFVACAPAGQPTEETSTTGMVVASGSLTVLNYNVWGLPEIITGSDPDIRLPQISPLLDEFDIALVQEDFAYHAELSEQTSHPYQSDSNHTGLVTPEEMGDGLNRFSRFPFSGFERVPWPSCNGTLECGGDCLATKGFTFARHQVEAGVEIDVYNLHNEAGRCDRDFVVRAASTEAILDEIDALSAERAVIVVGDFNLLLGDEGDEPLLEMWSAALRDVCTELDCPERDERGRRERAYLRNGTNVELTSVTHQLGHPAFFDEAGDALSNHPPQWVEIGWALVE
jgi:endonuclease/exonuclease/phosphatase family metal-dependent hydrolase